jgi:cyanophycinase
MNTLTKHRARPALGCGLLALALGAAALVSPAHAGGTDAKTGNAATYASKDYDLYRSGSDLDVKPPAATTPMLVLMGGGTDVDDAFRAMINKARGCSGISCTAKVDVVIVRASGADGYNASLMAMEGVDSVESLVIKTSAGANDPFVNKVVATADVLFIAGGDQWNYIKLWKGSTLDSTLQALSAKNVPMGGTSAGLAVLGQYDYSGQNGSITSAEAMSNPFDRKLTLDGGFLNDLPQMRGVITDSHLATRDRMGRLMTFLARQSSGTTLLRGIGVDEQTAVVVDDGIATVLGNPNGSGGLTGQAYFLQPSILPTTLKAKTPLTFRGVSVQKLRPLGGSFNLKTWAMFTPYQLSVETGVLTSSQLGGSVY